MRGMVVGEGGRLSGVLLYNDFTQCLLMREVHLMSETRIVDIMEFVDKSSRVINLKIRLVCIIIFRTSERIIKSGISGKEEQGENAEVVQKCMEKGRRNVLIRMEYAPGERSRGRHTTS